MKKFLIAAFAVCAANMLFALSFDDISAILKNPPQALEAGLIAAYDLAQEEDSAAAPSAPVTDPDLARNSKAEIKTFFVTKADIESRYPNSGNKYVEKTQKDGSVVQICPGAFISGGIAVLPKDCISKEDTLVKTSRYSSTGDLETTTKTAYSLQYAEIRLSDKSSIKIDATKKTDAAKIHFAGNYACITTGQKDKIKNLPKLGVFADGGNLRGFLKNTAKNSLLLAEGAASFEADSDNDNKAKCTRASCSGPAFFNDALMGVVIDSAIYGIEKSALPQAVLTALGDSNIKTFK